MSKTSTTNHISRPRPIKAAPVLVLIGLVAPLFASLPGAANEPANHANQIKALRLKQSHFFLGRTELTVAATSVRLDSTDRMSFTMVSSAPDWTVCVFRKDDKKIHCESLRQFAFSGLVPELLLAFRDRGLYSPLPPANLKCCGLDAKRVSDGKFMVEFLPLSGIAAPQVETIMYSAYRLPTQGGLPLRYVSVDEGRDWITGQQMAGHKVVELATSSAETVWVPADFFNSPKTYRSVKDMQEVVVSSQTRDQSADFQNLLEPDNSKTRGKGKP